MNFLIFVIIFSAAIVVALIIVFILFLVKGTKGAKEDRSLYEKGVISKEQYDSGFNQSTTEVVNENYKQVREEKRRPKPAAKQEDK